jgi:hypothetical protein
LVVGELGKMCRKARSKSLFAAHLRCSLAMGLKQLGQAARVVQRAVHSVEQWQIAQLGTTVNGALRKNLAAHLHCFRLTLKL